MKPVTTQKAPYAIAVDSGKSYYWCSCGKSKSQPFCDGAHQGSNFLPVEYKANESKTVYFCGCKLSAKQPLCDGAHSAF